MSSSGDELGLPSEGFVRLSQFLGPGRAIPIGKSTWWEGVRNGRFPQPVKLGPGITVWNVSDIRALYTRMSRGSL